MKIHPRVSSSRPLRRIVLALIAGSFGLVLATALPAQATGSAASAPEAAKKALKVRPKKLSSAEATEVDAIVENHRAAEARSREQHAAALKTLLQAGAPDDPEARKQWRARIRAAIAAERESAADLDEALREDLSHTSAKRKSAEN